MDLLYKKKVFLGIEQIVKKKDGVGANGGFDFTKKLKEEKRGGLGSTVDLILYRNRVNFEEKTWGFERTVDLKSAKKKTKKKLSQD